MFNRLNLLVLSLTGSSQKEEGRKEENPNSKKFCFVFFIFSVIPLFPNPSLFLVIWDLRR